MKTQDQQPPTTDKKPGTEKQTAGGVQTKAKADPSSMANDDRRLN